MASVKRSGGVVPRMRATVQPTANDPTTKAMPSGTVSKAAEEGRGVGADDERHQRAKRGEGHEAKHGCDLAANPGHFALIHMPTDTGSASITTSCARMSGIGAVKPNCLPHRTPIPRSSSGIVAAASRLEIAVSVTDNATEARAR